jgi:hypothetical protein
MKNTLDKKEKLATFEDEPRGSSNLSSRASFIQEKVYHQKSFEEIDFYLINKPFNFKYDAPLYGRVDNENMVIVPKKESLKQIKQYFVPTYSLNFVCDAFSDFYDFWELSKRKQIINEESPLYNFPSITSFVDPYALYQAFLQSQYDLFLEYVDKNKISKDIVNFNSFIRSFVNFIDQKLPMIPVLYSSFCSSKFCDLKINALTIDLVEDDSTDDNLKYNKYIKDANYSFLFNSVNTFGFIVDKNIPWRIVADINSTPMKNYMSKYDIKSNMVYDTLYEKAFLKDIEYFQVIMKKFYISYIENNLTIVKPEIKKCKQNNFVVKNNVNFRNRDVNSESENFWIKAYLFLLAREKNVNWDSSKFKDFSEKTLKIYQTLDLEQAMRYAHRSVNVVNVDKKKNNKYSL